MRADLLGTVSEVVTEVFCAVEIIDAEDLFDRVGKECLPFIGVGGLKLIERLPIQPQLDRVARNSEMPSESMDRLPRAEASSMRNSTGPVSGLRGSSSAAIIMEIISRRYRHSVRAG